MLFENSENKTSNSSHDHEHILWDVFSSNNLRHSVPLSVVLVAVYVVVLMSGICGNTLVILVVITKPHMRTVTNIFITNLASADLLVMLFCVPGALVANLFQRKCI